MNISSIIVKTLPQHYDSVWMNLMDSGLCEVHFGEKEKGIIIITIEGKNVEEEIDKLTKIQDIPYIISADMHMSYCEEELEEMKKEMDLETTVNELNKDKKAEEVVYKGSLKGKY